MISSLSKRLPRKPEFFRAASIVGMSLAACAALLSLIAVVWSVPGTRTDSPSNPNLEPKAFQRAPDPVTSDLPLWERIRFRRHIETRLPQYRQQFEGVAKAYKISWTLLAAQAYQESRWDPHAVSPTGVRGLMMLTRDTASSLGIQNRTDPTKSIVGGAGIFEILKNNFPATSVKSIASPSPSRPITSAWATSRMHKFWPAGWVKIRIPGMISRRRFPF